MNILYLCADLGIPVLGRTGAAVHVRSLVGALKSAGHAVVLAAPLLTKSPWEPPSDVDALVWHLPPPSDVALPILSVKAFNETIGATNGIPGELRRILYNVDVLKLLKHRLESSPPDVIYERASLFGTAGVALGQALNRPVIVELNAPLGLEQAYYRNGALGDWASQAERWMLTRADAVVVVSSILRDYVVSQGVASERVYVLPNGVDARRFHPGAPDPSVRARWNLNGGPVLGFVGGLRPWHGVEALPELLERLAVAHPDVRLVIAGGGPLRARLEQMFRDRGLMSHAVFTGTLTHDEVGALVRQFDVALAPYPAHEHMFYFSPLKIFEYMASGVAVVAPDLGQLSEVVRHGETGLLYRAGDLNALTAACERLIADTTLRRRLGQAAAEEILGRFTWNRNATRVGELAAALAAAKSVTA